MNNECFCCLCLTGTNQYKQMLNTSDESTEVYEVTVKYFDPILLTCRASDNSSMADNILCEICWSHIDDFHQFQNKVLEARSSIIEAINEKLQFKEETMLSIEEDFNDDIFENLSGRESGDLHEELFYVSDGIEGSQNSYSDSDEFPHEDNNDRCTDTFQRKNTSQCPKLTKTSIETKKNVSINKGKKTSKENYSRTVYTSEKGREIDQFIAQWKPELECDLCPVTAPNFNSLRSHFLGQHKTRFYIKCCERKFYRRCILVDHIRLHVNPETHKCDLCGKSSTSKYNLKLHKKIVHNDLRDYECEVCHKNFNHKPSLDRHLLTHAKGDKEFFCKTCGKGYVKQVQLNTHIRNVHSGFRICDQCGKKFYNTGSLKKHLIEHGVISQPKFPCDLCSVELKSKEALKRHKAAYHHDGSTIYVCSICGKVAANENALLSHKKFVHENDRKHKCTYCNKAFRTTTVLREHIATHTGEDLYQCPHCPQTFKTNANMHHHRKRIHPTEWAEARKNRLNVPLVNLDQLKRQVIL